jgi:predicted dienelactone hydrolase
MRTLLVALTFLLFGQIPAACAQNVAQPYHAGISRIEVPAEVPFTALIWYPTDAGEGSWQVGVRALPATHDAALADGKFPVVLLAHGGGSSGGSPLVLSELSAFLARSGYVVVAPFQGAFKGKSGLLFRPLQVKFALDAMLADPRFRQHADPARLGMLGFSLGGAVTLELAGAIPDWGHFEAYCGAHPDDVMSCGDRPDKISSQPIPRAPSSAEVPTPPHLPLKAIVLFDPLAAPFQSAGLLAVSMPVLLFRPEQSKLSGAVNTIGLATALPHPPKYQTLPGGHFVIVDICSPAVQAEAPEICSDPPGVDRAAVHTEIETKILKFFRENL